PSWRAAPRGAHHLPNQGAQRVLRPAADARTLPRRPIPRAVTDPSLVAKKLALVETCVRELRELSRPDAIPHDKLQEGFAQPTPQIAIQAALDVASHIVSDERLGEPRTNRDLMDLLERHGW